MANFLTKSYLLTQLKNFKSVILDNAYLGKSAKASSATTADSATKATQDGNGNTITYTYMKQYNPTGNGSFSLNRKADATIGEYSFAEGYSTIASVDYQHVQGKYNANDSNAVHIVGWGTSDSNRKNIHTIDTNGYGYFKGGVNYWEGTQAQYDALPTKDPKINYYITDGDGDHATAFYVNFDNTLGSGLSATNVQSAIDELSNNKLTIEKKSDGLYYKYADGTMIYYGRCEVNNVNVATAWGSIYESSRFNLGTFSIPFKSISSYNASISDGNCWLETIRDYSTTSKGNTNFVRPTSAYVTCKVNMIVVGTWK